MNEEDISVMLDEKLEALFIRLQYSLRSDLEQYLGSMKDPTGGEIIDGTRYLKTHAVCALLDISEKTLYRKRKSNNIGFVVKDGVYYYKVEDIANFMEQDYVSPITSKVKSRKKPGPSGSLANFL